MTNVNIPLYLREIYKKFCEKDTWFQEGNFWRGRNSDGSNGMGDLIYNTLVKIIYHQDTSDWAIKALEACHALLKAHKRWPDYMNDHPMVAKTWAARAVNRILNKIKRWGRRKNIAIIDKIIKEWKPFRYQGRMTRDPYTAFYAACIMLDRVDLIKDTKVAFICWRPDMWMWRKYLIKPNSVHLTLYRFLDGTKKPRLNYVMRLNALREYSIRAAKILR